MSKFPANAPIVRKGQRFLVTKDFPIVALVHCKAPFTSGFNFTIPKGTTIVACSDSAPRSAGFAALPQNYDEFETKHVPKEDRLSEKYAGYSLVIPYSEIGKRIKQIPT